MVVFPNAKINLGLSVVRKREDGFHDIETLFMPVPELRDVLEIVPSDRLSMTLYGRQFDGNPMDNLCVRAYRLLEKDYAIPPVSIYLHKAIPVGAGLGGGSSDASHTLTALNELFSLGLSADKLAEYASLLGSDCPFFIYNKPMFATGRGEILTPFEINLEAYEIRVITPYIFVSTKEAYSSVIPRERCENKAKMTLKEALSMPLGKWKDYLVNDFEKSVFLIHPEIAQLKQKLYDEGAIYASMSGSGSSLFGIFEKR